MIHINVLDWLNEAEEPFAQQPPTSDPSLQGMQVVGGDDSPQQQPEDDVMQDPTNADVEEEDENKDFEQWRKEFFELSIKGDVQEMLDAIGFIQDRKLETSQHKFIEDNLQILLYRQEANVQQVSKNIRNLIKENLDRTNPGTTLMQHILASLSQDAVLPEVFIKLSGFYGLKGDLHRKYLAALLGAVQTGGGASRADLLYSGKDYTIEISTRFHTQFGEITLGKWSLKTDDPQRYLKEPELERLTHGSPEEKQVLRRRIILESIAEKFRRRAFLIHIVHPDGTIHSLGWDLGESLIAAYKSGRLVVRGKESEQRDAMISDNGEIVSLIDLDILFVQETGEVDEYGRPQMIEMPFMSRRDSMLYLIADLETLQTASTVLSGMFFQGSPWNGNPSDVPTVRRCIPSLTELLSRKCYVQQQSNI